jgi:hypothetical protein
VSIFDQNGRIRVGRIWLYFLLAVLSIAALVWGGLAYSAGTSGTKGTLQIQQQRGSAANRAQWSATFTGLYGQLQADQQNIRLAATAAAGPHATAQDATNLEGVQQACFDDVAQWDGYLRNALAVVPDGYPQDQLQPALVCSTDSTGLLTP